MSSSVVQDQQGTKVFKQIAAERNLKDRTINALLSEDYDSVEVLATIEDRDIEALDITRGQRGLLKKWIVELKEAAAANPSINRSRDALAQVVTTALTAGSGKSPKGGRSGAATLKPRKPPRISHTRNSSVPGLGPEDKETLMAACMRATGLSSLTAKSRQDKENKQLDDDYDLNINALNISECLEQLNLGCKATTEVREHVTNHGVDGLDICLRNKLDQFKECPINIAIVGRSGTGKSSLINSLRNLRAKDPNAAPVGSVETTMEVTPYAFPKMKKARLWDVPGANTPNFPRDGYLEKIRFKEYDAVIIVSTERFTEDDLWLAQEAHRLLKPFFFVRTKIDVDISSNARDGDGDDEALLHNVRSQIQDKLSTYKLASDKVYLISTILADQPKWDYPLFIHDLLAKTPEKNMYATVLAMVSCSTEIITLKKRELRSRIDMVVLEALIQGNDYDTVLQDEIRLYTERLGITKADLERVNTAQFDDRIRHIVDILEDIVNHPVQECMTARRVGIWFFGIGYFVGKLIDVHRTRERHRLQALRREEVVQEARTILNIVLDRCEDVALAVLDTKKYL